MTRLRHQAVVRVGDGRGFMVEISHRERVIITAAHCLPHFPPAVGLISYLNERTYGALLGPLGAESTVRAECLFADPIADIAVLGSPDNQELSDEADAYEELMASMTPFVIGDAPKQGREFKQPQLYSNDVTIDGFWHDTPGQGPARLLSLDGQWIDCSVTRMGSNLSVDQGVVSGMSGSPIVSPDGRAIGLISSGPYNPVLKESLTPRFLRRKKSASKHEEIKP